MTTNDTPAVEPTTEQGAPPSEELALEPDTSLEVEQPEESSLEEPEPSKAGAEAAKYRTRLRAVESERDALSEHVAELQRTVIELTVADRLADPSDFSRFVNLDDLKGESGRIDSEKVTQSIDELLKRSPHLAAGTRRPVGMPRPLLGTPVGGPTERDTRTKLERAFPKGEGPRWSDFRKGGAREGELDSRSRKVRSVLGEETPS